ncbi:sensor histidine kinase [Algoriphagus algorifonticola]|uniref:sensor histidine kinase n=1 Tax=Algoriphagus algorifonticola TaxID=2593007 RepID=UPI0011A91872|nr:histidine kinase N-terminal 7TM domain-containing protein [Algoriphagus algorifonticola]
MEFIHNAFSTSLIISSLLVGGLSLYIAFKLSDSTRWMALTMFLMTIWGFFYGLELASTSLDQMIKLIYLEYIGISFTPAAWLVFSMIYTGYKKWSKPAVLVSVFLIPITTYLMVLTNDYHHLHYSSVGISNSGPFPLLDIEFGPWYYIHTIYSYIAFLLGTLILWSRFKNADPLYQTQSIFLIASGFFPLIFNLFYQVGIIKPFSEIDLTPYAFLLTYLILGFAIIRYRLFSLKPVAQNRIMESLTVGVLVFDSNEKLIDFNPAAKQFCFQENQIKIGVPAATLFNERKEIYKILQDAEETILLINTEKNGKEVNIRVKSIPMLDKTSGFYGVIILLDDQTEQIKVNNQLRQQANDLIQLNELKDKFFSIISHDLKGPIFGVKELIHMTQSNIISKEEFLTMLPEVSKNMEQVAILLENLLAWASSQLRGEHIQIQTFNIVTLLTQQQKLLDRIAQEKKIEIILESEDSIEILADRNMIDLVLRNLINNAVKFSSAGGKIKLTAKRLSKEVKVCIKDSGVGISNENLKKIREGISFTTRGLNNESGTGLGLVLVREYVKKNNGKLEVDSILGEGTTFCLYLPLSN